MATNINKPVGEPTAAGCGIMNTPAMVAVASGTVNVPIPNTAAKALVWGSGAAGSVSGTVQMAKYTVASGTVATGDALDVIGAVVIPLEVGGCSDGAGLYPNQIIVTATSKINIAFLCETPLGA